MWLKQIPKLVQENIQFCILSENYWKFPANAIIELWQVCYEISTEEENKMNNSKKFFLVIAQWSPVFYMVEANDPFMDKKKFDPNVKGTALKYFLGQGAKVNIYDLEGYTPLTLALMKNKDTQIVQMLVRGKFEQ